MFIVISVILLGVIVGYIFRNISFLQKVEKSISWTIFLLLFVLGLSIGSNDYYGKSTGFTYGVPIVFQERRQR